MFYQALSVLLLAAAAEAKRNTEDALQPEEKASLSIAFAVLFLAVGVLTAVSCKQGYRLRELELHLNLVEV